MSAPKQPTDEPAPTPAQRMMRSLTGAWISQALHVAAKLGIADRIGETPQPIDALAKSSESDPAALGRLLRALASIGVFVEDEQGRFSLTPLGACLRREAPDSVHAMAVMLGDEHYLAWGRLFDAVKTGRTAFDLEYGQEVFDYYNEHPESADVFHRAMTENARQSHLAVVDAYDFGQFKRVVDVGGGLGTLMVAILKAFPALQGVVFDQPSVVADAKSFVAEHGLTERVEVVGGDFFESVPAGADAYVLSTVIHDWDDARATTILRRVREAMGPQGTLLLVERVLAGRNEPDFGRFADLNMLVMTGGQERTADEYRALFAAAGCKLTRIVATRAASCLVEGTPA